MQHPVMDLPMTALNTTELHWKRLKINLFFFYLQSNKWDSGFPHSNCFEVSHSCIDKRCKYDIYKTSSVRRGSTFKDDSMYYERTASPDSPQEASKQAPGCNFWSALLPWAVQNLHQKEKTHMLPKLHRELEILQCLQLLYFSDIGEMIPCSNIL